MITKKTFLKVIPAVALACGALAFNFLGNGNGLVETKAADYSTSNRELVIGETSVSATFYLDNSIGNQLDMRGWLLCLYDANTKPAFDPVTRKIIGSADAHPHSMNNVAHYYYAENNSDQGNISVTWSSGAYDQKTAWEKDGKTPSAEGTTLGEVLDDQDWYIVVGPRHYHQGWGHDGIGAGGTGTGTADADYWENCDYYFGQKSNIVANNPSGEIYLDLTELPGWAGDNAKIAVYFWNGPTNAFSMFAVEDPILDNIFVASYELNFTPTKMKVARLKPETGDTPNWDYKWNESNEHDFHQHSVIGITDWNSSSWESKLATVKIFDKNGVAKKDIVLDHYKRNLDKRSEHYNDGVALAEKDTFYIDLKNSNYSNYSCLEAISGKFAKTTSGDKIEVQEGGAGTYSFYFDTTQNAEKLYITDPAIAAADRWAQSFMHDDCPYTDPVWSNFASSFKDLSSATKTIFVSADHFDPKADLTKNSYVNQAVQRYDYLINKYHYSNFMNRTYPGESSANGATLKATNTNVNALVIIIGTSATAILAGALFLLKKKKYE